MRRGRSGKKEQYKPAKQRVVRYWHDYLVCLYMTTSTLICGDIVHKISISEQNILKLVINLSHLAIPANKSSSMSFLEKGDKENFSISIGSV